MDRLVFSFNLSQVAYLFFGVFGQHHSHFKVDCLARQLKQRGIREEFEFEMICSFIEKSKYLNVMIL